MSRLINRLTTIALAVPAAITASANQAPVDLTRFTGLAKLILNASATGGAGQTADIKLQHSADGTTWADVPRAAFAQVTNAGPSVQELLVNTDSLKKFVRVADAMGGTSPTVTRSVVLVGTLAY